MKSEITLSYTGIALCLCGTFREPTPEEHVAAVKIQKVWRGFWVRKVKQARTPGMYCFELLFDTDFDLG